MIKAVFIYRKACSILSCSHHHHHHRVVPLAQISLTLYRHFSLSLIAFGRSSGQHPVTAHSCCMFELVVLPLLGHMWGSIGVNHLWARPCFSSSVLSWCYFSSFPGYFFLFWRFIVQNMSRKCCVPISCSQMIFSVGGPCISGVLLLHLSFLCLDLLVAWNITLVYQQFTFWELVSFILQLSVSFFVVYYKFSYSAFLLFVDIFRAVLSEFFVYSYWLLSRLGL